MRIAGLVFSSVLWAVVLARAMQTRNPVSIIAAVLCAALLVLAVIRQRRRRP